MSEHEKNMLDNNTYNLMEQLTIENKSLWRIKNNYKSDAHAQNCQPCKDFWDQLEKEKENQIKRLSELLKSNL
jgi:hypothetical protein